jgi:long-chain acyl-CoA synthetase
LEVDIELYRHDVIVSDEPPLKLSVVDIAPELPSQTLVFLHGFGGQSRQWIYQLQHFALRNRVIALDMHGHGRTGRWRGPISMERLIVDMRRALDRLEIRDPFVLLGHSFGGAIAAEFALEHPGLVDRLVLVATAGEFKLNPFYRAGLNLPMAFQRLIEPLTAHWLSASPVTLKPWYHNVLSNWSGWSIFRGLPMPTLVLRGHRDYVFERPLYEEVARAIPDCEDVDVGASGHMVMLERRDAVNRAIERFIGGGRTSWRAADFQPQIHVRAGLLEQRPWLVHYDDRVPATVAIPKVPVYQFLHSAARRFPRRTAVRFEGAALSYRRLQRWTNRFANALRALGLERGERVMLILPNSPQWIVAYFGILEAGGVAVLSLPLTNPEELERQVRDAGAAMIITTGMFLPVFRRLLESGELRHLILCRISDALPFAKRALVRLKREGDELKKVPGEESIHAFNDLLQERNADVLQVNLRPEDPAVIHYTGGTTDKPKGVLLSHSNLVANTIQTRHWMPDAEEGKERFLSVLPFSHSYGLTTGLNVPIALGATLLVKPRFVVKDVLRTIRRFRPTIFPGVPQMYTAVANYPGVRRYRIQSIKACISGSAPLPVEVQESFERLTRGRLVEGYGLTEASPVTHANPLYGRRKVGSIGIPVPSTDARIVDLRDPAKVVEVGQIGELVVKGPQVMAGYWRDEEATNETIVQDGWLLTGDVVEMDAEGYFRIIARKADMWYPGKPGQPAFPRDVEEVLYEIPQVKEAAVVAVARQPLAFLIAKERPPDPEAVIAYCERRLPPELVPRVVLFVEEFPRTFIGKVLRRELARRYADQQSWR